MIFLKLQTILKDIVDNGMGKVVDHGLYSRVGLRVDTRNGQWVRCLGSLVDKIVQEHTGENGTPFETADIH